jgi:hypothetical protein
MDLDNVKGWAAAKIKLLWRFKVAETKELLEKIATPVEKLPLMFVFVS